MSASLDDKSPVAGAAGNVAPDPPFQLSPAELVAELADADIEYPLAIIREIQRRKETMVPALIQVIEDATSKVRRGELVSCAPALALSLLIEFQAAEALDPLLASVSLPGEALLNSMATLSRRCSRCLCRR